MIFILDLRIYITPLILGWTISFINVTAGSYIITRAFRDQGRGFFNKVLLSMVVRMFAVAALVFLLVYFLKIDKIGFSVALFFFYFLFMILEINYMSAGRKNTKQVS
ncbi:MAG: hypothetical protein JSS91_11895 [Bacteroidetes bacterium]|nr:hypothetical protein [Bacteroidota bacterium]